MLQVQGIGKSFGRRAVLRDVSFDIREREILGLIGPNGSGKTTLLECLTELPGAKSKLYYVPDGIRPWPDQTLAWVIAFFQELFPGRDAARYIEILGLTPLLKSRLGWLSKGERKRAMLLLGLLTPQPILMLDEPFDGLDLRQAREAAALFRRESATRTLFLSIHDLEQAARICDRLVLLDSGRVAGEGTLAELRERAGVGPADSIAEVFLGLT